jgi:hypothetical protein
MDYKDKYIKYKTKYLGLKNINNQIGGKKIEKNKINKINKHIMEIKYSHKILF